ncbi:hypothetical protein [Rhodococcus sp. B50]|uniref:hypothetical protein n=1 Tax=Rhodococcus sp. B50 TaxID=2682847 RepID=UPI0027DE36E4|nr:hypothetical protein [Rhodococcus sp. B50]
MPALSRFARSGPCALAAVLSLSALVAGCGGPSDGAPAVTAATSTEVTVPVSAVTTTVLDPGAEPRSVARVAPAAGVQQGVVLTTRSEVFQRVGDDPQQDFSTPELTLPLSATVERAISDEDPSTVVDITVGSATSPDGTLGSALSDAEGSGAGLTIGPTGAISALRLEPAPDAANIARSAIEQAFYQAVYRIVSFPEEAIGVGAVWEIHQQVMSAGITLDQVGTATLVEREDDRITVDVKVEQTPRESTWVLPNGQGRLDIEQYTMAGEGSMTVDASLPLPVRGELTVRGDQTYVEPDGGARLSQSQVDRVGWATPDR